MDSKERDSLKVGQKLYNRSLEIYGTYIGSKDGNCYIRVNTIFQGEKVEHKWTKKWTDICNEIKPIDNNTCRCELTILMRYGCQCGKI